MSAATETQRISQAAVFDDVIYALGGSQNDNPNENPRILLASTLRWPLAARLAIAFSRLGCPVHAWCPAGHPLEKTHAVNRIHRSNALTPLRSLHAAIGSAAPDFIIPCDDDAAIYLHRLYERSSATGPSAAMRRLIERSLGTPASCSLAATRGELMRLAQAKGVRVPETGLIFSTADLDDWAAQHGFPAVLKIDGSWGGLGVTIVRDIEQAHSAFLTTTHPSMIRALSDLILRRDPTHMLSWLSGMRPRVSIQKFIAGRPANRAVACWRGEVLAGISVVSLQTQNPTGPATVVRVIDSEEMSEAARRLVGELGLSGFCGFDFVIEATSDAAYLIEVNPRATPIGHLALGAGQDLPAALHARLRGAPAPSGDTHIRSDVIALFPGEWCRDPLSPYLRTAFHDVPWTESELVRDCVGLSWEERGLAARIRARLNPRRLPRPASFPAKNLSAHSTAPEN